MSLLFFDGFDNGLTADLSKRYGYGTGGVSVLPGQGRWNKGGCLRTVVSGSGTGFHVERTVPASDTLIVGANLFIVGSSLTDYSVISFMDGATHQLSLNLPNGQVAIRRGNYAGTVIHSSGQYLTLNAWNYIEVKVKFHATLGTIEVRVNGAVVVNLTNQNTISSANPYATSVRLGAALIASGTYDLLWDDFYICDTLGTTNNNFLGEIKVETVVPIADGSRTDFTPSSNIAPTKHRYWRLYVYENVGTSFITLYEMQLRETPGGPNVATGGTASASSVINDTQTADKAFDGSGTTYWQSNYAVVNTWLQYDFGAGNEKDIREFVLAPPNNDNPKSFSLQYSDDGVNFTNFITPPDQPGIWAASRTFTWGGVATEHYKMVDDTYGVLGDYVRSDVVGAVDTYKFPALAASITGTIKAVQLSNVLAKDDAGARSGGNFILSGATELTTGSTVLGGATAATLTLHEVDPATGVAWTKAGLNAAEFGVTVTG